jgi:SdrD B-like domain
MTTGVILTLLDSAGKPIGTAATNAAGAYVFDDIEPGQYTVVETQPKAYPNSVSDYDEDPESDAGDADKTVDNNISVTLTAGEDDKANNFVDSDFWLRILHPRSARMRMEICQSTCFAGEVKLSTKLSSRRC